MLAQARSRDRPGSTASARSDRSTPAFLSTINVNKCYRSPMPVPKRKTSRSNTRHRRAKWVATAPTLVTVSIAGVAYRVPRRLVAAARRGLLDVDRLPPARG